MILASNDSPKETMTMLSTLKHPPSTGLLCCSLLVWGAVLFAGGEAQQHSGGEPRSFFYSAVSAIGADTTSPSPIEARSCRTYDWFDAPENGWESESYVSLPGSHYASLHELTCKWAAYQYELSLDATRLPKYVRSVGDSLRLGEGTFAYAVEMIEKGDSAPGKDLYFIGETGDSLYYHEVHHQQYSAKTEQWRKIRALRPLDVPGAEAQYLWFEYETGSKRNVDGSISASASWRGHIYTYDSRRGFRHLQWAPIRSEVRKDGQVTGATQWDISVPEPGIMLIEPRLEKGEGTKLEPPRHWIGRHVIDKTATTKREVEMPASNLTRIIDTTEVDNWREKYEQKY